MANENAEMAEFAKNLWENYIKPRTKLMFTDTVSFYRATVIAVPEDGYVTVRRPQDNPVSVRVLQANSNLKIGDVVTVICLGKNTSKNQFVLLSGTSESRLSSSIWYGTSDSSSMSDTKAVTCNAYSYIDNSLLAIGFSKGNLLANTISLDINGTGARPVYYNGKKTAAGNILTWNDNEVLTFVSSDEAYHFVARTDIMPTSGGTFTGYVGFKGDTKFEGNVDMNGELDVENGTLQVDASGVTAKNLKIESYNTGTVIPIKNGGTGATSIEGARAALRITEASKETWYGTSTAGSLTAIKTVDCANFVYADDEIITIKFSTGNELTALIQLDINNTGAKDVWWNGAVTTSTNALTWSNGEELTFICTNDQYHLMSRSNALPMSGGTVTGDLTVTGNISASVGIPQYSSTTFADTADATGGTGVDVTISKLGKRVHFSYEGYYMNDSSSLEVGTGKDIATIPTGYRPAKEEVRVFGVMNDTGTTVVAYAVCRIWTTGVFRTLVKLLSGGTIASNAEFYIPYSFDYETA